MLEQLLNISEDVVEPTPSQYPELLATIARCENKRQMFVVAGSYSGQG